jgi:estrogen-related receptor beta like 1
LNDHVHEFHRQQDLLAQAKNHYRHCSTGITEKSQQLAQLTAELSTIKEEMEETGQNVTDGGLHFSFLSIKSELIYLGPLVKIKKAIEELNRDIVRVDVRIAVLEHTLMQSKVREKEEANDEKADYLLNEPDFD